MDASQNQIIDPNHIRIKAAKLGHAFKSPALRLLMAFLIFILIFGGFAIIYFTKVSAGWLLVALAPPLIMLLSWSKHALIDPPLHEEWGINGLLDTECLTLINTAPTPASIAAMIPATKSGNFFLSRMELHPDIFKQIAEALGNDPAAVVAKALEIRQNTESPSVTGAIFAVAMIETYPDHDNFLHRVQLELTDLYQGIGWYNHINESIKAHDRKVRTGGIGRDFAFGFTPLLQRFATNISTATSVYTYLPRGSRSETIDKMIQIFSSDGRQNIALVGPLGSGRTTLIYAFAERLLDAESNIPSSLKFRQVFFLDAISLISAVGERGELETLVTQLINEAYNAKNVILCLDNAHLFFEEGTGSVDISNILLPYLEAGKQRIILSMDEQRFLEISSKNVALSSSLNKVLVKPTDEKDTILVLQDQAPMIEYKNHVFYTYRALKEAYRLSLRYMYDIEMPGRAIKLLEAAANYAENGIVGAHTLQSTIQETQGIKVGGSTDNTSNEERDKLLNLETLIHERMVDQTEAVAAVSNALRRAVAGVRSEGRPIGTFLFLGPTGVGKTELAKAISETYFDGEKNIIRLDLNEFVMANDVAKLIADGAENELSLTAQAMKHPFSVILLDEIEKAHPQVLTTLLQLLDEGVLRDEKGHEVSFRDTIVIATSNAGANEIREHINDGQNLADFKDKLIDELINSNQFRPEFLNRFDEICLFKPLGKPELKQILALIIKSVNKTLEPQKITVTLDEAASEILVEHGYDPRMGARPMRRIVQKTVENIVAKRVLTGDVASGSTLNITGAEVAAELEAE
ncbi:ATP-dependent Clp protease ATP-binding subunit [Candidatus Saccharibacteria bacterium]|nr:ATP-dependent Clp protease ATP-binding subunit [Candidatus Saccharibacteria bacterium]